MTQSDPDFTDAFKKFVSEKHKGKNSRAAKELGVPRQHMRSYLNGTVPLADRKQECLAVLIRAGYYAVSKAQEVPQGVTLMTENVTGRADTVMVANVLEYLLDLVKKQQAADGKSAVTFGSGES